MAKTTKPNSNLVDIWIVLMTGNEYHSFDWNNQLVQVAFAEPAYWQTLIVPECCNRIGGIRLIWTFSVISIITKPGAYNNSINNASVRVAERNVEWTTLSVCRHKATFVRNNENNNAHNIDWVPVRGRGERRKVPKSVRWAAFLSLACLKIITDQKWNTKIKGIESTVVRASSIVVVVASRVRTMSREFVHRGGGCGCLGLEIIITMIARRASVVMHPFNERASQSWCSKDDSSSKENNLPGNLGCKRQFGSLFGIASSIVLYICWCTNVMERTIGDVIDDSDVGGSEGSRWLTDLLPRSWHCHHSRTIPSELRYKVTISRIFRETKSKTR